MGFKNKGISIELTSLLDIIMIMLFWIAATSSQQSQEAQKKAQQEADKQVAQAQAEVLQTKDELSSQIEDMQRYVNVVEGFEDGEMLTISISTREGTDYLTVTKASRQLLDTPVDSGTDIESEIKQALDDVTADDKNKIVLAAFVYDGETALYRNVTAVKDALQDLRSDYRQMYLTVVNTGT